ncbi:MAG TPA: lysylphosphatidylglycerol synthase transmembrane domain-containing protein [Gaiellaceae bacterium]|nr:lysylphosphatidylglycerol synthase transmembrane domain-containing protein [Gaiellaceae bacterium]
MSLFSSRPGARRFRRATDVILLVPALVALAILVAAYPPGPFERAVAAALNALPSWINPIWAFAFDLFWLWALLLVVVVAVARRGAAALQAVVSAVLALAVALVSARLASGGWPDLGDALRESSSAPAFPAVRVALAASVILTIGPYLIRPAQRVNRLVLVLGFTGGLFLDHASPSGNLAALMVAVVASSAVRLAFGTAAGRPGLAEVGVALGELGIEAKHVELAERQTAGVVLAHGLDAEGRRLAIKLHGRDAYDNQLLEKIWRFLWYEDAGPPLRLSRGQVAEYEAFVTLLARSFDVPSYEVLRAGTTSGDNGLLVLRGDARQLGELAADELGDELLGRSWSSLRLLHRARIVHRHLDPETIVLFGDEVGFVDFGSATTAASEDRRLTDRAQLLVATATCCGVERSLAAAVEALGADGVGELLPYLQSAALEGPLQEAAERSGIDVDDLRKEAALRVDAKEPGLVRLRRVTWGSVIQIGLLLLAATALLSFATGIDWHEFRVAVGDAVWGWIAVGAIVAQTPRLTQSASTLGSVAADLRFGPVYAMQLATGYMNLALPSVAARLTINIRFFQRQGVPPAAAVTAGGIDSFASMVIQTILLVLLLLFSEASLDVDLTAPSGGLLVILLVLVGLVVAAVVAVVVVRRLRQLVTGRLRTWWPQVKSALGTLRSGSKLALLVFGSLATEALFATALGLFALGLGSHVGLTDLLVINISVSLLSSFIPVPGGIGVTELGLTVGLTSAGMDEASALAAVLLYRISTFYLPPIWGFFALRWLQRRSYL